MTDYQLAPVGLLLGKRLWRGSPQRMFGYEGRKWVCYYWFNGFTHLSLGLHIYWPAPNVEVHLPGGFLRIGVRAT